jgi:general secretion pathway protein N
MARAMSAPSRAGARAGWWLLATTLALMVLVISLLPANWVAHWLAGRSAGRVVLGDARGTIWSGDAVLGFAAGDAAYSLPGRLVWQLGWAGPLVLRLDVSHAGVLEAPVSLRLGWQEFQIGAGTLRLPLGLAVLAGAPFNTLRPQGDARLHWDTLGLQNGEWSGQGSAELAQVSFALSPVRPLGDYRLAWVARQAGLEWSVSTLRGLLRLEGKGAWSARQGAQFTGHAAPVAGAAPEQVRRLQSLLDVLGPREGDGVRLQSGSGGATLK